MYIEASGRSTGDYAKLEFAVPPYNSQSCLTFFYHMYGFDMGTLNVFGGNDTIFTKSGNQGNYWKGVTMTVHSPHTVSTERLVYITSIISSSCCFLEFDCKRFSSVQFT